MPKVNNLKNQKKFSKDYQPENRGRKKKGFRNRSTIIREFLDITIKFTNPLTHKPEELTLEECMHLVQINKAIFQEDSNAYKMILDSAYGSPDKNIEIQLREDGKQEVIPIFKWGEEAKGVSNEEEE